MNKEVIGLLLQGATLLWFIVGLVPRQIRDLSYRDSDIPTSRQKAIDRLKWVLFLSTVSLIFLGMFGFIRLLIVLYVGHSTPFVDELVFWSNRLIWPVMIISSYWIYKDNKKEVE